MKVVHLTTDESRGGAAIAASRLSEAMNKSGIESLIVTASSNLSVSSLLFRKIIKPLYRWLATIFLSDIFTTKGLFSFLNIGSNVCNIECVKNADIIYIHWINNAFLSANCLFSLFQLNKQIVVVMHDMWYCTGGCHHSFDCFNYKNGCNSCPLFKSLFSKYLVSREAQTKNKLFHSRNDIKIIAPSNWLTRISLDSYVLGGCDISPIPNPLDIDRFRVIDRKFSRELLGLPLEKKIVCFGAYSGIDNPYKGWQYLQESLAILAHEKLDLEVLIFGSSFNSEIERLIPFKTYFTGKICDTSSLIAIYNAIDVFVTPSLADNFPNVIVEAMACGTPVVGFDIGGIPELIESLVTGYLARYKDSNDLANGIKYVLNTENYNSLSKNSRVKAKNLCDYKIVIDQHISLWNIK